MRITRYALSLLAAAACCSAAMARGQKVEKGFVSLFNGKDLTGWHVAPDPKPNGWSVKDGVLQNRRPSVNLLSDREYLNFEIRYEYRVLGNSGVKLRQRYEIQI